jgi:hypothetical protein
MSGENLWEQLLTRGNERVKAIMNMLVESPYFYKEDDEVAFNFLRRHRSEFERFFEFFFGWTLTVDGKCARVYKERWYNAAITESARDCFNFTRRDECIAFMMILEFFEHQLDENDLTVEDRDNVRFRFGDCLDFCARRFAELFEGAAEKYSPEYVRGKILRAVFPALERYRFIRKIPLPPDETITEEQTIYEALPALYHYNASYLHKHIDEVAAIAAGRTADAREEADNHASGAEQTPVAVGEEDAVE